VWTRKLVGTMYGLQTAAWETTDLVGWADTLGNARLHMSIVWRHHNWF